MFFPKSFISTWEGRFLSQEKATRVALPRNVELCTITQKLSTAIIILEAKGLVNRLVNKISIPGHDLPLTLFAIFPQKAWNMLQL
jgi:hypothetical protein